MGVVGDKDAAMITMGAMMGLSVAGAALQKFGDLMDKGWGTALKDFEWFGRDCLLEFGVLDNSLSPIGNLILLALKLEETERSIETMIDCIEAYIDWDIFLRLRRSATEPNYVSKL